MAREAFETSSIFLYCCLVPSSVQYGCILIPRPHLSTFIDLGTLKPGTCGRTGGLLTKVTQQCSGTWGGLDHAGAISWGRAGRTLSGLVCQTLYSVPVGLTLPGLCKESNHPVSTVRSSSNNFAFRLWNQPLNLPGRTKIGG